ncbi:MFS transporter [Haloglycomyces albus]|uniref:MFS transporter n=1 Tax=Haloglycomyces albus TaxID=526067 RepID=UPI00046D55BC|nr:MFS transporter [Haloglycomyces albus]
MITTAATSPTRHGSWIHHWNPEDPRQWKDWGRLTARRNLVWSVACEHIGFSVWVMLSIVAPYLPEIGYGFSTTQLFWLIAVPNVVGALVRLPYTAAVGTFGGRNWTIISLSALVPPTVLLAWNLRDPDTSYGWFLLAAALAGLGGGNFASSMANISYFYPDRLRGTALGVNAAGGNIGAPMVQLTGPVVVGVGVIGTGTLTDAGDRIWLYNVPLMWLLLILVAIAGARRGMDNLAMSRSSLREQVPVLKYPHTWIMSALYVGTFGSFIGYSFAFPLIINLQFPAFESIWLTALGPLLGALARPLGGWLADRYSGAPLTGTCFAVMGIGSLVAVWAVSQSSFTVFFLAFIVLFCAAGTANGTTYQSIPVIFQATHSHLPATTVKRLTAAALGWISCIGALGGFLINQALRTSYEQSASITGALVGFSLAYLALATLNWWFYQRRAFGTRIPSLARERV